MRGILFLALLVPACLWAASDDEGSPWREATRVTIPAGPLTLNQALDALQVAGNRCLLQLGVDGSQVAHFDQDVDGSWWQAVAATAEAFDLAVLAPPPAPAPTGPSIHMGSVHAMQVSSRSGNQQASTTLRQPLADRSGPLLLGTAGAPPVASTSVGPWRLAVDQRRLYRARLMSGAVSWVELDCELRSEPRLHGAVVWDATWRLDGASDDHGNPLTFGPPTAAGVFEDANPPVRMVDASAAANVAPLVIQGLSNDTTAITLTGRLELTVRRPWHQEVALALDVWQSLEVGPGQTVLVILTGPDQDRIPYEHGLRLRANTLTMFIPGGENASLLPEATVRRSDGVVLPVTGTGTHRSNRGVMATRTIAGLLQGQDLVVSLDGEYHIDRLELPLDLEVPLP